MSIKERIEACLSKAIDRVVLIELAGDLTHGDFVCNAALSYAQTLGQPPRALAEQLTGALKDDSALSREIEVSIAGPGFVNISLTNEARALCVEQAADNAVLLENYRGTKVLLEYSAPNIAKPMHFGHLRSTTIGDGLARIFRSLGADVVTVNHLGDWGSQFGKLLAAYKRWGKDLNLAHATIRDLLGLYIQFHDAIKDDPELAAAGAAEFAKLEAGDPENRRLWEQMRNLSLTYFHQMYDRLGISMDEPDLSESFYEPMIPPLIAKAKEQGIAIESEGALVIPVGDDIPPCLIQKRDGATLYATRDLAAIKYRTKHWHPNRLLYVVAADQSLHFTQITRAAEKLDLLDGAEIIHVPFGLVVGADGKKFATREGRIIELETVLNEACDRAKELLQEKSPDMTRDEAEMVAEIVGIGAIKYQDLQQNRVTTVTFSWDKMLTLQGNTGPYIQYTIARARSILRKSSDVVSSSDGFVWMDDVELLLLRTLMRFPWMVLRAGQDYAPNHVTDWLFQAASQFNRLYEHAPILHADPTDQRRRLFLTSMTDRLLTKGLDLLGIQAPDTL